MRFQTKNGVLIAQANGETLRIEPWGKDSLRVRATMLPGFSGKDWALTEVPEKTEAKAEQFAVDHLEIDGSMGKRTSASITNGKIRAVVNFAGVITFYKEDQEILREYHRCYDGTISKESRCLKTVNREWKGVIGGSEYSLNLKFESNDEEKIFGMGQYQQKYMDLKGCTLELAQRNSQISVPFAVSSLGYGMLWNNPAVGQVTFGKNYTEWTARSTKQMDYWITAGDTPDEIEQAYGRAVGTTPMMPEYGLGFWQCKLRYRTQDEVLSVARQYQKEGIHIDQIVIDFFHWTVQGDWKFDTDFWPDPKAMVEELKEMFHQSIDNYLSLCEKIGKNPDKEFKGTFNIRISPEMHKKAALEAARQKITLNQYITQAIKQSFEPKEPTKEMIIYMPYELKQSIWHGYSDTNLTSLYKNEPTWSKKESFKYAGN